MVEGTGDLLSREDLFAIFAEALEFAGVGLYRYREDGVVLFVDRGALRLLDLDLDPVEVVGRNIDELFQRLPDGGSLRHAVLRHGAVRQYEHHYRTLSGQERWVYDYAWQVEPDGDAQGDDALAVIQVISQDITAIKQTTLALAASEARYRAVADQSLQGLLLLQGDPLRVVYGNEIFARSIGRTREEVQGMLASDLPDRLDAPEQALVDKHIQHVLSTPGARQRLDLCVRRPDGELRYLRLSLGHIRLGNERAIQVACIDETERHRAEEARRLMEERMQESQRLESLGKLAGGVAHDFNNLLAVIQGNTELAQMRLEGQHRAHRHLSRITEASHRASDLCRQLLAYSGRATARLDPVDLNALIRDTAQLLRVAMPAQVSLRFAFMPDLPVVQGDPTQLGQIFINLLTNASEAVDAKLSHGSQVAGEILLSTGLRLLSRETLDVMVLGQGRPPGWYLRLVVQDDGIGMSEDALAYLFDPFFTTKLTGRGLGLATVLGIVRAHRGALDVSSELGRGTRFVIYLPRPAARDVVSDDAMTGTPPDGQAAPGPAMSVDPVALVADDEDSVRGVLAAMLEHLGYRVVQAVDGADALQRYRASGGVIDLAIIDLTMPGVGGAQVCRDLRRLSPELPIVLTSGHDITELAGCIQKADTPAGPVIFLRKPFRLAQVRRALASMGPPGE